MNPSLRTEYAEIVDSIAAKKSLRQKNSTRLTFKKIQDASENRSILIYFLPEDFDLEKLYRLGLCA